MLVPSSERHPSLPVLFPAPAFDAEQLNLTRWVPRPQSLCRVASKEFSHTSRAPSHHLTRCQVGQLEQERQFIALGLEGRQREIKDQLQICSGVKVEQWPCLTL